MFLNLAISKLLLGPAAPTYLSSRVACVQFLSSSLDKYPYIVKLQHARYST